MLEILPCYTGVLSFGWQHLSVVEMYPFLSDERGSLNLDTDCRNVGIPVELFFAAPGAGRATRRAGALDADRQERQARPGGESRLRQWGSVLSLGVVEPPLAFVTRMEWREMDVVVHVPVSHYPVR